MRFLTFMCTSNHQITDDNVFEGADLKIATMYLFSSCIFSVIGICCPWYTDSFDMVYTASSLQSSWHRWILATVDNHVCTAAIHRDMPLTWTWIVISFMEYDFDQRPKKLISFMEYDFDQRPKKRGVHMMFIFVSSVPQI